MFVRLLLLLLLFPRFEFIAHEITLFSVHPPIIVNLFYYSISFHLFLMILLKTFTKIGAANTQNTRFEYSYFLERTIILSTYVHIAKFPQLLNSKNTQQKKTKCLCDVKLDLWSPRFMGFWIYFFYTWINPVP